MAARRTARAQDRLSESGPASQTPDPHAPRVSKSERNALLFANVASRQGAMDLAPALEVLREGGVRVLDERPPEYDDAPTEFTTQRAELEEEAAAEVERRLRGLGYLE